MSIIYRQPNINELLQFFENIHGNIHGIEIIDDQNITEESRITEKNKTTELTDKIKKIDFKMLETNRNGMKIKHNTNRKARKYYTDRNLK